MMIKTIILAFVAAVAQNLGVIASVAADQVAYGAYGYDTYDGSNQWNPYSYYQAEPAIASQSQNIYRSPFNLGQISTYSKAIDTPFSSVRKADIRVNNPGYPGLVASPYVSHVGVAPFAPVTKGAAPGRVLGVAYSAAPAVSHMTFTNGLGVSYSW